MIGVPFFLVFAALAWMSGVDDAKTYRRFAEARPAASQVRSFARKSWLPPRWNVEVAWGQATGPPRMATLVLGTRDQLWRHPDADIGEWKDVLVAPDGSGDALLADRLPKPPLGLLGVEMDPTQLGFSLFFLGGAALCVLFKDRIRRELDDTSRLAALAERERPLLTKKHRLEPPELEPGAVEAIARILATVPKLKRAYLVRKRLHYGPGGTQLVLALSFGYAYEFRNNRQDDDAVARALRSIGQGDGLIAIVLEKQYFASLRGRIARVPGALIYPAARQA